MRHLRRTSNGAARDCRRLCIWDFTAVCDTRSGATRCCIATSTPHSCILKCVCNLVGRPRDLGRACDFSSRPAARHSCSPTTKPRSSQNSSPRPWLAHYSLIFSTRQTCTHKRRTGTSAGFVDAQTAAVTRTALLSSHVAVRRVDRGTRLTIGNLLQTKPSRNIQPTRQSPCAVRLPTAPCSS